MKIRCLIAFVVCFAICGTMYAQTEDTTSETPGSESAGPEKVQPFTLVNTATHTLESKKIGESFAINVALPGAYGTEDKKYPVVYLIDSFQVHFPVVASQLRRLRFGGEVPRVIVVGIGYSSNDFSRIVGVRTRDLTATNDEAYTETYPLPADVKPGGADDLSISSTTK